MQYQSIRASWEIVFVNPIRLGIIGTGLAVEKLHWPALARMKDRYEIVAFTNRSEEKARHFAQYSGTPMERYSPDYESLLKRDDVDAVLISLPIPLNFPVTEAALKAGKHVICEKPAGIDINEGRQFVDLVRSFPDLTVLIAENWFYRDDLRAARRLLDQQPIGRIHLMIWRLVSQLVPRENEFSSTPWRHDPGYIGGPHLDAGVHHIAQIRLLLGDVERINGETQHANETHGGPSDLAMTFRFASGAVGSYTAAYLDIPTPNEMNDMKIYGTEGIMTISRNTIRIDRPDQAPEELTVEMEDGGYYNEFLNFHDAVHGKAPLVGTVEQTYRNMQIVDAGIASALTGTVISAERWPVPLSPVAVPLWEPTAD
jgi:predicted dehydrogenase